MATEISDAFVETHYASVDPAFFDDSKFEEEEELKEKCWEGLRKIIVAGAEATEKFFLTHEFNKEDADKWCRQNANDLSEDLLKTVWQGEKKETVFGKEDSIYKEIGFFLTNIMNEAYDKLPSDVGEELGYDSLKQDYESMFEDDVYEMLLYEFD